MEKQREFFYFPVKSDFLVDVEKIKETYNELLTDGTGTVYFKKELLDKLQQFFTIPVKSAIIFKQGPGRKQELHVDGFKVDRLKSSSWALNIPLSGYDESVMEWYTGKYRLEEAKPTPTGDPKYLKIIWDEDGILADSYKLTKPTIVRIAVPHRVINYSQTHTRKLLTVRFQTDTSLLALADI